MRIASVAGRARLVDPEGGSRDIATVSAGAFGPTVLEVLADWAAFRTWAQTATGAEALERGEPEPFDPGQADAVVGAPAQVFAVGLNYRAHAAEAGLALPEVPMVFTKFASCIAPAFGQVGAYTPKVDWEIEVAVVIGVGGRDIAVADAWEHVAGVTAAQDYSARDTQFASSSNPQFSLGKSYPGFLPLGPVLVTPDEYADRNSIALSCSVNGVQRQSSSTADLVFSVPECIAYISSIATLLAGDVILTGTPQGVGMGLKPPVFLSPGDQVVSSVELVGEMRQVCVEVGA